MHIALLYPPPWKIAPRGEAPYPAPEGPPPGTADPAAAFSGDACATPYGLLTLAEQARADGHRVTVLNLYSFAWPDIETLVRALDADLIGLSVFVSNRRGAILTASLARKAHPRATILAGGPFPSALPEEFLARAGAVDAVVVGEGEATVREILEALARGEPLGDIPGTVRRENGALRRGPPRERIDELDRLPPPYREHGGYVVITSRGCPGRCTFCGSPALWGRALRFHSTRYILDLLERLVREHGRRALAIKDDTFTANRRRVLEVCEGIRERGLNLLWSCDTRADHLDEEVLRAMRRAGCQRISLGVESADPGILKRIQKRIDLDQVRRATRAAQALGFQVRYYMMVGNRGESAATVRRSFDFVREMRPNQAVFTILSLYPGTEEFAIGEREGYVTREAFFDESFQNYTAVVGTPSPELRADLDRIRSTGGFYEVREYDVAEREAVLELLPDIPAAHLDLAGALYTAGRYDEAEAAVRRAREMGFPLPGLSENYLACIQAARGDLQGVADHLVRAAELGRHAVVEQNLRSLREWIAAGGPKSGRELLLVAHHDFEELVHREQPTTPGPVLLPDTSATASGQVRMIWPVY